MRILSVLAVALAPTLALAGAQNVSTAIAEKGLAATERDLASIAEPSPDDLFALGGVRFLRGIEKTMQIRWQHNATLDEAGRFPNLPVLRLPVAPNPAARPFRADLITEMFATLGADMEQSRAALAAIPEGSDPALEINLRDLWFDVNMNARRDEGEDLMMIAATSVLPRRGGGAGADMQPDPVVRFDTADVAWLSAYTHLLSGLSELVIAFEPATAIQAVMDSNARLADLRGNIPPGNAMEMQMGRFVDQFAMVYGALNRRPDAAHTRAAREHFLAMIADNLVFWTKLAEETDNDREWIPNDDQQAALGFEVPQGAGEAWLAVLKDGEDILNGKLLVPYWRIAPAGGVNVRKMFDDPPAVDVVTWVQGSGLLPYLERGPVASSESVRSFERLVSGETALFAVLFN